MELEEGFTLCRGTGGYAKGPRAKGTAVSVSVPVVCPLGTAPVALYHTHPRGSAQPSQQDMKAARQTGVPYVCVRARGRTRCYRTRP